MIDTREKSIGGHSYRVTQFPGRMGMRMQVRLAKLLGPSVGAMMGDAKNGNVLDMQVSGDVMGGALNLLADRLDEAEIERLVVDLLSGTRRDGEELGPERIDLVFAGAYGELLQVLGFVLEVNYGDFLGALATGSGVVAAGQGAASPESSRTN